MSRVKIPKGWRKLRVGSTTIDRDKFLSQLGWTEIGSFEDVAKNEIVIRRKSTKKVSK